MSTTRKLRNQRDVARGTAYAYLLDNWISGHDQRAITVLFDTLVRDGRHNIAPKSDRPDGAS